MVRPLSAVMASLALAAGVVAAQNPENKEPASDPTALFQQLDANSDGQLDDGEVGEEQRRLFKRLLRKGDKDNDGKLSRAEFIAALQEENPQPPADGPNRPGNERMRQFLEANPEEIFKRLDANGDGKVELQEVPEQVREGLGRFFEQADANRDKSVSLEEFQRGHEYLRRLMGANQPPNGQNRPVNVGEGPLFKALDTNEDGTLSAEELTAATASLKKLDRDGDGQITRREIMPMMPPGGAPAARRPGLGNPQQMLERLKQLDRNGDGKLAADELPPFLQGRFEKLDSNGDGSIDQDELKKAAEVIREQMRQQGGRRQQPAKSPENKS